MKAFWKFLGVAALAAGLAPYKIEKDEETGESSYQSLLMKITSAPDEESADKRHIAINLGEGVLTSKLLAMAEKKAKDEPHLFSDEISVEYAPVVEPAVAEEVEAVEPAAADEAEKEVEQIGEAAAITAEEVSAPEVEEAPAAEETGAEEPKEEV